MLYGHDEGTYLAEAVRISRPRESTIRRRLRHGSVASTKQPTAQGFTWLVEVSQADDLNDQAANGHAQDELIAFLKEQIVQK